MEMEGGSSEGTRLGITGYVHSFGSTSGDEARTIPGLSGAGQYFPEMTTNNLLWMSGSKLTKGDLIKESLDGTDLLSCSLSWPLCPRSPLLDYHCPWYSAR